MFKKIYAPIDNTDVSEKVILEAITLAKANNAELRISHVANLEQITFGIEMIGVAELKDTLIEIGNKLLDHVKDLAKSNNLNVEVKLLESYGADLSELIVEDAKKWNADLFVLGSHHLGAFSHLITGGVVEDIAHDTEIPILLITKHK